MYCEAENRCTIITTCETGTTAIGAISRLINKGLVIINMIGVWAEGEKNTKNGDESLTSGAKYSGVPQKVFVVAP